MVLDVDKIIYYGRYYSFEDETNENLWWFNRDDLEVYSTQKLIDEYSFNNIDEIVLSDRYIRLFKTDIITVEKSFMCQYYPRYAIMVLENSRKNDYDISFKTFIDENNLTREWFEYEKAKLLEDAIDWCNENAIIFYE